MLKLGGSTPQNPLKLFVAGYNWSAKLIDKSRVNESIVDEPKMIIKYDFYNDDYQDTWLSW